ncbi:hypothetical protein DZK27_01910 [Rhodobacteraceae bacterium 63075]|nr:hypothetical protein DZK27_01910 [Rhodobacteraceae bacterium 63075]
MPTDYRIYLFIILASGLIVYAVSFVPALTSDGSGGSARVDERRYEAAFSREMDHCLAQGGDTDCQCFASISGLILAGDRPALPNAVYADKRELARGQAAGSC